MAYDLKQEILSCRGSENAEKELPVLVSSQTARVDALSLRGIFSSTL